MRLRLAFLLVLLMPGIHMSRALAEYSIQFMASEDAITSPIFSIVRVEPYIGGLRLFLAAADPNAVAGLLARGELEAQLSDHLNETVSAVSLSLGKAVWCIEGGPAVYLDYDAPLPSCDGSPPFRIEYFFKVPVTLGPGRDLAIGQEPDFLWIIEELEAGAPIATRG